MKNYLMAFFDLSDKITKGDISVNIRHSSKLKMLDVFLIENGNIIKSWYLFTDFEDHEEQFLKIKTELEGFIQA
jgi:hypothetical protein